MYVDAATCIYMYVCTCFYCPYSSAYTCILEHVHMHVHVCNIYIANSKENIGFLKLSS